MKKQKEPIDPVVRKHTGYPPKKITGAKTRLERHVQKWINEQAPYYDNGAIGVMKDLRNGGCESGFVTHLIYYDDTTKFFQTYRRDISALLADIAGNFEDLHSMFGDKWNSSDPLAQEQLNRNLLAWYAFETVAGILADRNGI